MIQEGRGRLGTRPLIAITQGDPAGIGPEILLKVAARWSPKQPWTPLLIAERAALEAVREHVPSEAWRSLHDLGGKPAPGPEEIGRLAESGKIGLLDPVRRRRVVPLGSPGVADARGALSALDRGLELARDGVAAALVTAPIGKAVIARHLEPSFRGHTDYLADRLGGLRYGRDYLMAFLGSELRVALLSTHVPLRHALDELSEARVLAALRCLWRAVAAGDSRPRLALAGLNPHAGEEGLLGEEEAAILAPAVARARAEGIEVRGPESPDTLFYRARSGEFDWVLALYHDQGLIPVKTLGFGSATNWTLGLPILRTSVDHGTAYGIAGAGAADEEPLWSVIETTLELITRQSGPAPSAATKPAT